MKKDYMARLERAARWRLPRQEAEDVIADYQDIVNAQPRSDEELLHDLGRPHDLDGFVAMWGMMEPWIGPRGLVSRSVYLSRWAMCLLPHFVSYLALYWLVKARVHDRRWAAAYILTLAAVVISMETVALTMSMDVTTPFEVGMRANLLKCAVFTAIGLLGTGVSLC